MVYRRTPGVCARQEQTRAVILEAAGDLVAVAGLVGTSVAGVAAAAGVGVGTVYRYFPSKSDLVCEVVRQICQHEIDVVAAASVPEVGSPSERLAAAVDVFASRALRGGRIAYAMIAEPAEAEVEVVRLEIRAELAGVFAAVVADGIDTGDFPNQIPSITGVALVGAISEVLVGPLSPRTAELAAANEVLGAIGAFASRAVRLP